MTYHASPTDSTTTARPTATTTRTARASTVAAMTVTAASTNSVDGSPSTSTMP
jgi:hypothetical protein